MRLKCIDSRAAFSSVQIDRQDSLLIGLPSEVPRSERRVAGSAETRCLLYGKYSVFLRLFQGGEELCLAFVILH